MINYHKKRLIKNNINYYLFLVLPLVIYLTFCILPTLQAVYTSFFEWDGISDKTFVGLDNYIRIFTTDTAFRTSFINTVIYTVTVTVFNNAIGLFIAILIYQKSKINNIYRLLFYLPVIFSSVTIGFIWSFIYDPNIGTLNTVLGLLGLTSWQNVWLAKETVAVLAVSVVHIWWSIGTSMVLYIAGLQNVPHELLESASIDGCNKWNQFWKITFPILAPVIAVVVVLSTIGSFKTFDLIYVMTGGGSNYSSSVLALLSYKEAFTFGKVGTASAIAVVLLIIVSIITFVQLKVFKERK